TVILDGEVFGAAISEEQADLFQETMSNVSRHEPSPDANLQVRFFDVLHLDGVDLIDRSLEERLATLHALVDGRYRVPGIVTADVDEAEAFAEEALALG